MIKVDTSVEWPKTKIWGWAEGFLVLFIYFYLFKSLKYLE
jgi:hypothetical protein